MQFTHDYIRQQYRHILEAGYSILTCGQYYLLKQQGQLPVKTLVNRVDIDFSVKKTRTLVQLFNELGIKATFFLRLHAPEYNPFDFENYRIVKELVASGHELGYHSEVIDQAAIWSEDAADCLRRDVDVINRMFGTGIKGVASHGGMTGLNNLDFWKDRSPKDFGLWYEAYDERDFNLFNHSLYISDSEWTRWKCYDNGKLVAGDRRSPAEHVADGHPLIYLLIHPDTYYHSHFYE